ncbi:MAG: hypothetical protein LBH68_06245, partial [Bifidobacteriaceae bacterium]|nr:hypothetical protein [Bifidobacteriaceae bacterium]
MYRIWLALADVDPGLAGAKIAAFAASMAVVTVPAQFAWQAGFTGPAAFMVIFLVMVAGLLIYFTAGCAILRSAVSNYAARLALGERGHAAETTAMALVCDLGAHGAVLVSWGVTPAKAALVSVSAVFFIYPVHFLVTTLWTLQTEVRNV